MSVSEATTLRLSPTTDTSVGGIAEGHVFVGVRHLERFTQRCVRGDNIPIRFDKAIVSALNEFQCCARCMSTWHAQCWPLGLVKHSPIHSFLIHGLVHVLSDINLSYILLQQRIA